MSLRRKIHELTEELILEELIKMAGNPKTDADKKFLVQVLKETMEEEEQFEDGALDGYSVEQLEKMLLQDMKVKDESQEDNNSDSE